MDRFRRLGLQRRIMLYVTVGLSAMFGVVAVLGLDAIDQATQLVYRERLATAHTTAGIFERDFAKVASEVREAGPELGSGPAARGGSAARLLSRFARESAPIPFFRVTGVWLLDGAGRAIDEAGEPQSADASALDPIARLVGTTSDPVLILPGVGRVGGSLPLVTIVVRPDPRDAAAPVVVVHTASVNRTDPYRPAGDAVPEPPVAAGAQHMDEYHLEVIGPDGVTRLGIGPDERPGEVSPHFAAIGDLVAGGAAATLLHAPRSGEETEPHVMAAVPLGKTSLYLVLEQPVDVALALPRRLRDQLFISIGVGFVLTLLVAWVTTRHVVTPTEQLTRAAERMAEGDLTSPIAVSAQDEVGQLADNIELMRLRLGAAHELVEQTNRELESRVADRTARLDRVLRLTINAQEEERHRLARELHDETAQGLAALAIALDRARDALGAGTADAEPRQRIGEARAIVGRLLEDTRRLMLGLRPAVLDDLGLVPAIRWLCETNLASQAIDVSIKADSTSARLPAHVEVALFRIVQEAVTNVARHAGAHAVGIDLTVSDGVARVTVSDDGRGFDVGGAGGHIDTTSGFGLDGMRERVRLFGGSMEIRSSVGGGTQVIAEVPIAQEAG